LLRKKDGVTTHLNFLHNRNIELTIKIFHVMENLCHEVVVFV
jgi:hypothetical protein